MSSLKADIKDAATEQQWYLLQWRSDQGETPDVSKKRKYKAYKTYATDEISTQAGHTIIHLPPYHVVMNPTEHGDILWNSFAPSSSRIPWEVEEMVPSGT